MKILIVDDNKEIVGFFKEILIRKGHSIQAAHDGDTALELIRANNFDLAFLDYNMQGLTGLELVKYIKKNNLQIRTVMVTGYPEIEESFMRRVGVDEYLTKPINMKDLENILDKYSKPSA